MGGDFISGSTLAWAAKTGGAVNTGVGFGSGLIIGDGFMTGGVAAGEYGGEIVSSKVAAGVGGVTGVGTKIFG